MTMLIEITHTDNTIYTSDITDRLKELEEMRTDSDRYAEYNDGHQDEYLKLKAFADDIGEYAFENQETLINEDYFEEYAQDLAVDTGAIESDAPWPVYCIDWEHACRELKMDYSDAEFDGVTYYFHA